MRLYDEQNVPPLTTTAQPPTDIPGVASHGHRFPALRARKPRQPTRRRPSGVYPLGASMNSRSSKTVTDCIDPGSVIAAYRCRRRRADSRRTDASLAPPRLGARACGRPQQRSTNRRPARSRRRHVSSEHGREAMSDVGVGKGEETTDHRRPRRARSRGQARPRITKEGRSVELGSSPLPITIVLHRSLLGYPAPDLPALVRLADVRWEAGEELPTTSLWR